MIDVSTSFCDPELGVDHDWGGNPLQTDPVLVNIKAIWCRHAVRRPKLGLPSYEPTIFGTNSFSFLYRLGH